MAEKPTFVRNAILQLDKLSLDERSGWRKRSEKRIEELVSIFRAGQFGQSAACGVQVLPEEDADGASVIDDGCSTVAALKKLQAEGFEEDPQLKEIFTHGLRVTVVRYSDNGDLINRRAWNVGKHDEESNTVRWSSIHLKVTVAKDLHGQLGDWNNVGKELTRRFNFSASTVKRWVRCASGLDEAVLTELGKDAFEGMKGNAVWDNEYLMGQGAKARSKLGPQYAVEALRLFMEQGEVPGKLFVEKVCMPLKVIEVWDQLMRKRYGSVCSLSKAYERLMKRLMTYDGLQLVVATVAAGVPLHGAGPSNPGVADCQALVAEFDRCKAGGLPPPDRIPTPEELAKEAEVKKKAEEEKRKLEKAAEEEARKKAVEESQREALESMSLAPPSVEDSDKTEQAQKDDDRENALTARLKADMQRVQFHDTPEALVAVMGQPLSHCMRAIVVIAAPTSGWGAISAYMQTAKDLADKYKSGSGQSKFRILILPLLGSRFDIMGKIQDKAKTLFPEWAIITTQLQRQATQTWNHRPTFAMMICEKEDVAQENSVLTLPKATQRQVIKEGLTLRCKSLSCSLRAQGGAAGLGAANAADALTSEIDAEDRQPSQLEALQAELAEMEAEADADGDDLVASQESLGDGVSAAPNPAGAAGQPEEHIVELWPFAFATSFWISVLSALGQGDKAQVVAVLSPSAHPGPWVAARKMALDVFVLTRRQNAHARQHGLQLGESLRKRELAPDAPPAAEKRKRQDAPFQSILGAVVGDQQVLEAYDVSTGAEWVDGINKCLSGDALDACAGRLVAEQLDKLELKITHMDPTTGRGLETTKFMRDGDTFPASSLFFDAEAVLVAWLRQHGSSNQKYQDRIVKLNGVMKNGAPQTVWAVLVGAAQYLNGYVGIRPRPNAKLQFTPGGGFNEGALQVVISTRNGAGVAKGTQLLLDYGPDFDMAAAAQAVTSKSFRGALDSVFDSQKKWLPAEAAGHDAAAAEEAEAEKKAAEESRKREAEEAQVAEAAKKAKADEDAKKAKEEAEEAAKAKARHRESTVRNKGFYFQPVPVI